MTKRIKDIVASLRRENYSYACIGKKLGISHNTVKSICRRNGYIPTKRYKTKRDKESLMICKNCGVILDNSHGQKKSFCSDSCRIEWWKNARKNSRK